MKRKGPSLDASNTKVSRSSSTTAINRLPATQPVSGSTKHSGKNTVIRSSQSTMSHSISKDTLDSSQNNEQQKLCGSCCVDIADNELYDTTVQCCLCDRHYHGACCNINESLMEYLHIIADIGGWCCQVCRKTKRSTNNPKALNQTQKNAENIDNEGLEVQIQSPMHDMDAEVSVNGNDSRGDGENDKTVKNESMEQSRVTVTRGALLPQGVLEDQLNALGRVVETRQWEAVPPQQNMTIDAIPSDYQNREQQHIHHPNMGDVPVDLTSGFRWVHLLRVASLSRSKGTILR